jgi:hypothetical protein
VSALSREQDVLDLRACNTQAKSMKQDLGKNIDRVIDRTDALLQNHQNSNWLLDFRNDLQTVRAKLDGKIGPVSNALKEDVQRALDRFGVESGQSQRAGSGGSSMAPSVQDIDDDDDDDDDGGGGGGGDDIAVCEQIPPDDISPQVVKDAFRRIMSNPSLRASIRFDLVPFLKRIYDNVREAQRIASETSNGVLPMQETIKMFGGGRTQSRKTPLKLMAFI